MITLHSRVVVKIDLSELEKDYETMIWLCFVVEKLPEHCIVSCIMLLTKTGYVE